MPLLPSFLLPLHCRVLWIAPVPPLYPSAGRILNSSLFAGAPYLCCAVLGKPSLARLSLSLFLFSQEERAKLTSLANRLLAHRPAQQPLGSSWNDLCHRHALSAGVHLVRMHQQPMELVCISIRSRTRNRYALVTTWITSAIADEVRSF